MKSKRKLRSTILFTLARIRRLAVRREIILLPKRTTCPAVHSTAPNLRHFVVDVVKNKCHAFHTRRKYGARASHSVAVVRGDSRSTGVQMACGESRIAACARTIHDKASWSLANVKVAGFATRSLVHCCRDTRRYRQDDPGRSQRSIHQQQSRFFN